MAEEKKKRFTFPSAYTILFVLIIVVVMTFAKRKQKW